jgi:hypothetical protein
MRKLCFCLAILMCFAVAANAETKAEVFGGYQFTRLDGGPNLNGWNGALTGDIGHFFGITGDFSGVYGSGLHFQTYTFGPEVHAHLPLIKPFAHALFGGARASSGGISSNGFDMMFGGGIDAGHGPLAFRVAQFDWMTTHFSGFTDHKNVRVSSGIVIRF